MDKGLVIKWIAALKSGIYAQVTGCLKRNDSFCCLGVACDVAGLSWFSRERYPSGYSTVTTNEGIEEVSWLGLPPVIRDQLGLTFEQECKLSAMNDSGNYTFFEIADAIEEMLLKDSASTNGILEV